MPFPASAVGLTLEPRAWTVTTREILAYAAGLGASEPAFLDDTASDGLAALPFQCVTPEWPVVLSTRTALADVLPPEEARRAVHAVQDSTFHRRIRPGDRLLTEGRLIAARAIPVGVLTIARLDTRDAESGEPVVTTWTSSIYRGVALDGGDLAFETPPDPPVDLAAPLSEGVKATVLPIPREMAHVYSECADIWNPIHTERAVALAAGLPDIILHGTATWALAGLTVLRRYAGSDGRRLKRLSGRFSAMIVPGETITVRHAASGEPGVIRFEVLNAAGRPAISQGFAVLN